METQLKKIYSGMIFLLFLLSITPVQASVSLSVSPIEGGSSLRFSRSDVQSSLSHEMRVRITSTDSSQYQVFQRWTQPLSLSGASGFERDSLQFYAVSGSNASGTLYGNMPEYITMSDQLVYTSSGDGTSDGFILVYQVDPERLESSGEYVGRMVLTVRPIGGGQTSEVYVDVFVDAELSFSFEVRGEKAADAIRLLKGTNGDVVQDHIAFAFEGNAGELRVYQEVLDPIALVTDSQDLAKGNVFFRGIGVSDGVQVETPQRLDFGRQLIYRSWESSDQWELEYALELDTAFPVMAGQYQGRLRYAVERGNQFFKNYDFDIEMTIEPLFKLELSFDHGGMAFDALYPGAAPQERKVWVKVRSNINRPFTVTQHVTGPMQNESQQSMDPGSFLVKTVNQDKGPGETALKDFQEVSLDDTCLYTSDAQGSSAEFEVIYRVMPYAEMSSGNYRAEITYTLGEI